MSKYSVIELTQELIRRESITPEDKGCQKLLAKLLSKAAFNIEHKRFGKVDNLFAWHGESNDGKNLMFLGHTDVVATGDVSLWKHPPFSANLDGNYLYGRGSADMKASVAAFTLALIEFVTLNPHHKGKVSLMLTSDEEGIAIDGVKKMMPHIAKNHSFDYCIVGEPSSSEQLGDVVRIGRRGSLHVNITIHGKQGHVAYPENARNPVFLAAGFIQDLEKLQWDQGNADFPPTSFQISSVKTSTTISNIIPADLIIQGNFRYCSTSSESTLAKQLQQLLKQHKLNYSLDWNLSGLPFHCTNRLLRNALKDSILRTTGQKPIFNAAGGTSDGRFVALYGVEVVELGPINKTIHQINEKILISDIIKLQTTYSEILSKLVLE